MSAPGPFVKPQPCSALEEDVGYVQAQAPAFNEWSHPLDQLSQQEVHSTGVAVKAHAASLGISEVRFNSIMLQEPPKSDLIAWEAGKGPRPARVAQAIVIAPKLGEAGMAIEARVDLTHMLVDAAGASGGVRITLWKPLPGVQPMTTPDDNFFAEEVIKGDPRVRSILQERYGITDMATVLCDTWACHGAPEHLNCRRLMQAFLYLRTRPGDNEYAHPLDLVPIVDLNQAKVVHMDMYQRAPPVPMKEVNYHRDLACEQRPWRSDLKPLNITQPQGPSFEVEGSLVKWQKWRVRVGFNPREGLVLHQLGYEDGGRLRPVLHRASLVEMIVPYGDPNYPYVRKSALDVGDYGMGLCANSLELGCDCLGHIRYFDAVLNDCRGNPVLLRKAVCMHEEDAGILYKHYDCRTGHVETRRSRRLVISSISTFQNYEYCAYWHLYQDGTIEFQLKLTGILSTSVAPVDEVLPRHGVRVADRVNATVHQHFFCMRLDPAIDDEEGGKRVVVSEVTATPMTPGPGNPHANGFFMKEVDLLTTHQAQRSVDYGGARCWKLKNPGVINPVSQEPVAFRLLPGVTPSLMAQEGSLVRKRGKFATANLWVTPYADNQRYPAGEHVVQSKECMGLAHWTKEDRSLVDADPVVWYSYGITHNPRVEDFPIMPVEIVGFMLKPASFFTMNPALDVPPERNLASREELPGSYKKPNTRGGGMPPIIAAAACCGSTAGASGGTSASPATAAAPGVSAGRSSGAHPAVACCAAAAGAAAAAPGLIPSRL